MNREITDKGKTATQKKKGCITYSGKRTVDDNIDVFVDGKSLSPNESLKFRNHSPNGFNWGYGGSGPSQLALAILLDFKGREYAEKYYMQFKWDFVSKWNDSWSITGDEIDVWLEAQGKM